MPTTMTKEEREAFLAEARIGVISINDPGKGPLAVPIWYDYEIGGDAWFMTPRNSMKGRRLEVGARMSLCVQDENPPYRYVSVEGPVTAIQSYTIDRDMLPMAQRYLGEKGGEAYVAPQRAGHSEADSIKVVVRPERWLTLDLNKA